MRKDIKTPWLNSEMLQKIKDFETVLNAKFPTVSDIKLTHIQKTVIKTISTIRYKMNWFKYPYEIKLLQSKWLKYRRPELEGF
jgi:hypothetical protein